MLFHGQLECIYSESGKFKWLNDLQDPTLIKWPGLGKCYEVIKQKLVNKENHSVHTYTYWLPHQFLKTQESLAWQGIFFWKSGCVHHYIFKIVLRRGYDNEE